MIAPVDELTASTIGTDSFYSTEIQYFRDVSAWYHIVLAVDTTQATASNRVKLYCNCVWTKI